MRATLARYWFRCLCWLLARTHPSYGVIDYTHYDAALAVVAKQREFIERSGFLNASGYHAQRKLRRGVIALTTALLAVPVEPQ